MRMKCRIRLNSCLNSLKPFAGSPLAACVKPSTYLIMKRLLLTALCVSSFAQAQERVPDKHVRFIPLGELPVWKEDLKGGIRVQRKAPPGALPPSEVSYVYRDRVKSMRLSLRSFTDMASFSGKGEGILLREGKGEEAKAFLKAGMPASTKSLGVLFRDNTKMTWDDPKMLLLKDDADAFPVGQMRFVNVSDRTVVVQMAGAKPFGLAAGKVAMKPIKEGSTGIKVGYVTEDGSKKAIWQNNVKVQKGQRVQCFFYKAQGKKPRDAVKFHSVPESVPATPRVR